ncbi:hypothetical protein PENTCL1PPCAC_26105 [Pristionchus entomophagus]|uniref:Uncharacterized protein n=1 Tax=Pristionchus entomophagus TaxID=358040 RepID=A0AAV5UAL4_9BILA|nr:hypothetical protein PENTCL1PPCAC_26105 [Pristionchus entomophagus]
MKLHALLERRSIGCVFSMRGRRGREQLLQPAQLQLLYLSGRRRREPRDLRLRALVLRESVREFLDFCTTPIDCKLVQGESALALRFLSHYSLPPLLKSLLQVESTYQPA